MCAFCASEIKYDKEIVWKGYRTHEESFIFGPYFFKRRALKVGSTEPLGLIKHEKELDMPI